MQTWQCLQVDKPEGFYWCYDSFRLLIPLKCADSNCCMSTQYVSDVGQHVGRTHVPYSDAVSVRYISIGRFPSSKWFCSIKLCYIFKKLEWCHHGVLHVPGSTLQTPPNHLTKGLFTLWTTWQEGSYCDFFFLGTEGFLKVLMLLQKSFHTV